MYLRLELSYLIYITSFGALSSLFELQFAFGQGILVKRGKVGSNLVNAFTDFIFFVEELLKCVSKTHMPSFDTVLSSLWQFLQVCMRVFSSLALMDI